MRKMLFSLGLALALLAAMGGWLALNREPVPVRAAANPGRVAVSLPDLLPPAQEGEVCDCSDDTYSCQEDFATQQEAKACLDFCLALGYGDVHHLDRDEDGIPCENLPVGEEITPTVVIPTPVPPAGTPTPLIPIPLPGEVMPTVIPPEEAAKITNNVVRNGDFEFGFYQVPQLGFEAPDVGNVPFSWNWYRNQAYGKYDIDNNETFGLTCPDNTTLGTTGRNALGIYMQSTDQPDARLGVYQTVDVVPGVEYLFSISGTIQVQKGGTSPDVNNRIELLFDHTGGTNWQATPHEKWTIVPWREQELEFNLSGPNDPDLPTVENYFTVVKARSNKLTIFLTGWRKWPNWRSSVTTFDCISLVPLSTVDVGALVPELTKFSTTDVDKALEGGTGPAPAQPAAVGAPGLPVTGIEMILPAIIIPDSGGVPESNKGNSILIAVASVVVLVGLVGAGFWSARRRK